MDAVEFVKEFGRMCRSYINGCEKCALYGKGCTIGSHKDNPETLIKTVKKWSDKHPRKTRQDVFLEQWPDAMVYSDGVLDIYPCILEKARRCDKCNNGCTECRHEFWNQVVE
nr:MAG TPA: protein of unknown function (DUF1998) [Caudoviricetes sp.]